MHETLLLGIAASELTVLLTSEPRRWSRRLIVFLSLLLVVICYSWFFLGVSALANALGAALALVWFGWDLTDPSARGVLTRWACASLGLVALMSLNPLSFPLLSLLAGRSIDLIIAVVFLATGPANYLITAILQCARGRSSDPVPGWTKEPVLPAMLSHWHKGGEETEAADPDKAPISAGSIPIVSHKEGSAEGSGDGVALRGGRWIGPLERLLIIILAGAGAEVAIGAVVAAKGVIRFPEISQDSSGEKAEEFLIGSVSSWILAALVSLFIRVVIGN